MKSEKSVVLFKQLHKTFPFSQHTIEEQLEVQAALLIVLIGQNDTIARYRGLHEERPVGRLRDGLFGEEEATANLVARRIEQHA